MRHIALLLTLTLTLLSLGHCGPNDTLGDAGNKSDAASEWQADNTKPIADKKDVVDVADNAPTDTGSSDTQAQDNTIPDTVVQKDNTTTPDESAADVAQEPAQEPLVPEKEPTEQQAPDKGQRRIPVFIAQGDIGRTTMSCDDGKTWKANRSWELEGDPAVCGKKAKVECYNTACEFQQKGTCTTKTPCDCDHHPGAPQGIVYGAGWFVGTWGWGPPGSVRRSEDGVNWKTVIDGTSYGGIAFGANTFVTGSRSPKVSGDGGKSWQDGGKADLKTPEGTIHNVRSLSFVGTGGPSGRFFMIGASGTRRDILYSSDKGKTWTRPTKFDRDCAASTRGVALGKGIIVMINRGGLVCRSTDGGKTFAATKLPEAPTTRPVWDGKAFHYWRRGKRYSSPDGKLWKATPLKLASGTGNVDIGAFAYNPQTGTYVAVNTGWKAWYTKQVFFRSTDGITWSKLPTSAFTPSHRIRHIGFGYVKPSAKGCQ